MVEHSPQILANEKKATTTNIMQNWCFVRTAGLQEILAFLFCSTNRRDQNQKSKTGILNGVLKCPIILSSESTSYY